MKFRLGRYEPVPGHRLPELHIETRSFLFDIDINPRFPFGWCAALNIPRDQPWKLHLHSAWHAWSGEGNSIDLHIGRLMIDLEMPTWWRFRETSRETTLNPAGNPMVRVDGYWYRTWPYIPWPPVHVSRRK